MRDALAEALQEYQGALLVISHDRSLLRSVVDELVLVSDGSLAPFEEDLDGYAKWLSDYRTRVAGDALSTKSSGATPVDSAMQKKQRKREQADQRAKLRPLRAAVEKQEKKLGQLLTQLSDTRDRLASNELYNSEQKEELAKQLSLEASQKQQVEACEEQLLECMQTLELAEGEIRS